MQKFFPFHFRGTSAPTVSLPISCRSVGHYITFAGWHNPPSAKNFVELFWGIRGSGVFRVDRTEYCLKPDEVAVLFPGDVHHITSLDEWEFRWFTLDSALAEAVVRAFSLDRAPKEAGPCPEQLFTRLSNELDDISPQGQRAAGATAYEILTLACGRLTEEDGGVARSVRHCINLIRERYSEPELNVSALADEIGIHRTSLSRNFQSIMHTTPIAYLTAFRISRALKLLRETEFPIEEVARQTGFARGNYFTRVIRKHAGMIPREIRKKGWS